MLSSYGSEHLSVKIKYMLATNDIYRNVERRVSKNKKKHTYRVYRSLYPLIMSSLHISQT
jgi:hypothetical protein